MRYLYDVRTWTIDEPGPRSYVIHDDGEVLANVARVPIRRLGDAMMPYTNPHENYDESRVVVCATAPDGTRYFYVDRVRVMAGPAPALVVAANGVDRVGTVAVRTGGLGNLFELLTGGSGGGFGLYDARGTVMAGLAGPGLRNRGAPGTITDPSDRPIGGYRTTISPYSPRRRTYTVELTQHPPEPAHTLILASLIAVELMTPQL